MLYDPYLVVGTGRSGTSTLARILHTKLNVFMGHEFLASDVTNPEGFYEDIGFYNANKAFWTGCINFESWAHLVEQAIFERQGLKKPWGFKESRMAFLLGFYLQLFDNPKIIRCKRKQDLVIASLQKCYGFSKKKATSFWLGREKRLDRLLTGKDVLTVCFDNKQLSDEEIIECLKRKYKDL